MKKTHAHLLVICALVLGSVAPATAAEPSSPPELPGPMLDRLRELQEKDPAGFRDLLRRSLSARLLWAARGEARPADFPMELAAENSARGWGTKVSGLDLRKGGFGYESDIDR